MVAGTGKPHPTGMSGEPALLNLSLDGSQLDKVSKFAGGDSQRNADGRAGDDGILTGQDLKIIAKTGKDWSGIEWSIQLRPVAANDQCVGKQIEEQVSTRLY